MALFNKLFSSRKKTCSKRQDDACDKLFSFSNDQIRVVLFRECDLWGRKLLFDSQTVQKIPLVGNGVQPDADDFAGEAQKKATRYAEISNGFGYLCAKPNGDVSQLGEMIFGSVAMSYRGTSYKIHSLSSPNRLMCTQIFQSPRHSRRGGRNSAPSRSCMHNSQVSSQSLEHSLRLEDSSNSATSFSDHSVHSTTSDTLLVCRGNHSTPLDVPQAQTSIPNSSVVGDSGFCGGGHSYSSTSSCPQSIPISDTNRGGGGGVTFSCGSIYKRWLRSTSTSLEYSASSLTGSASADECYTKPHPRTSKLGLAIIIQFTSEYEERLEQFLMDHAALIEGMVWRARQGAETAVIRHSNFFSLMSEVAATTSQWLVNLLSGPKLSAHVWLTLSADCDSSFSIINNNNSGSRIFGNDSTSVSSSSKSDLSNSYESTNGLDKSSEFAFLRFLKSEWDSFGGGGGGGGGGGAGGKRGGAEKDCIAEKFVRDFCELLETIDVKHTNFFISTLITAVLTHHLGWVATTLRPPDDVLSDLKTGNPLWGQLNDLYGAVGHPTKMAHTVIMGSNKTELVTKILNTLTYFIRCSHIERKTIVRVDTERENFEVNRICRENFCIPKENYKKYEDHLKEIAAVNDHLKEIAAVNCNNINNNNNNVAKPPKVGLTKTNTYSSDLNNLPKSKHEIMDRITSLGLQAIHTPPLENERQFDFLRLSASENLFHDKSSKTLTRVPRTSALSCLDTSDPESYDAKTSLHKCHSHSDNVVFVLGENEELVGLHKNVKGKKPERPSTLHIPEKPPPCKKRPFCDDPFFQDSDFVKYESTYSLKPSTSWTQLCGDESESKYLSDVATCSTSAELRKEKEFSRSHSVPPEGGNKSDGGKPESTPKYRYTGVKFNFQQHPQIFENYMRSKNIELSNLSFSEKTMKFNGTLSKDFDFSVSQNEPVVVETLQTPSNASELEFTSELIVEKQNMQQAKEVTDEIPKSFVRSALPNTIIKEPKYLCRKENVLIRKLRTVELPMPKSSYVVPSPLPATYTRSLFRGFGEHYISDMVLQGTCLPKSHWETHLRKDLGLAVRHPILDQPVEEAVAIVANTDTWEVQLMSSHTFVIDKGSTGVHVGMSQLVANMLESLLHMWKLHAPPEYCLMHIEQRLQEFCVRSKALAQLLLATDFCSMELLTSTLQLEVNDVPLLMAIASTHSPQVMQKYGLSFQ